MSVQEKILIIYPVTGDKYYYLGKRIKNIFKDVGISKYNIDLVSVLDLPTFLVDDDAMYTAAFVPESIAFKNIKDESIELIFPLLLDVALNHLYYYNSAGHLYQFAGNIHNAELVSQSFDTLKRLGIVDADGKVVYEFKEEKGDTHE